MSADTTGTDTDDERRRLESEAAERIRLTENLEAERSRQQASTEAEERRLHDGAEAELRLREERLTDSGS